MEHSGNESAMRIVQLEGALASLQTSLNRLDREAAASLDVGSAEDIQVLRLLADSGSIRVSGLARRRGASNATTSARIKRLEERGLVSRERPVGDRRAVAVELTPHGRDAAAASFALRRELLVAVAEPDIDADVLARLAAAIEQISGHVSQE